MPDPTPEQLAAQEKMRDWMERYRQTPSTSGPFGDILRINDTVENLLAAAGAGRFAIAPDTGEAIIKQLAEVQKQAEGMRQLAQQAAVDPRFGGGYAEQIGDFVKSVAADASGSAEEVLTKFGEQLDQLRTAVAESTGNYRALEEDSAGDITRAGGRP